MKTKSYTFPNRFRDIRNLQEGFTLLELMVTIVIIGCLSAAAIPLLVGQSKALQATKDKQTGAMPAPSAPVADPTPVTRSAPVEFPWGIVLGIGVSAILVVALVALIVWFVRQNKASVVTSKNNIAGWEKLITRHRELRMQWASYELDMAKLIDFPLMTDMREPVTAALHKALKKAADLEPANAKKMAAHPVVNSDFWNAVNDLDAAFHTAEQTAKKVAWSKFTPSERKSLSTAKNLLALALDSGASPAERQAAYKRVFKELQGLIEFPEKARLEIEARHQLALAA
jgi:prepilin-type N-terminal cleavage/methylation domain-containing protein